MAAEPKSENPVRLDPWQEIVDVHWKQQQPNPGYYIQLFCSVYGGGTWLQEYGGTDAGSYSFPPTLPDGEYWDSFLTSSTITGCERFTGVDTATPARVVSIYDADGYSIDWTQDEVSFSQPSLPNTYTFAERVYGANQGVLIDPYGWCIVYDTGNDYVPDIPFSNYYYPPAAITRVGYLLTDEQKYRYAGSGVHDFHYYKKLTYGQPLVPLGFLDLAPASISFRGKTYTQVANKVNTASYFNGGFDTKYGFFADVIYKRSS